MAKRIEFQKFAQAFRKEQINLPKILGNIALVHFRKSFRDEGFTDETLSKWVPRKHQNKADRRTKRRRALLVDSGNLRKSLRVKSANFRSIRVGSYGIPYAERHNKGLGGMPKRQFIGRSAMLRRKMEDRIGREIRKVFG